jgi:hypothetical protein
VIAVSGKMVLQCKQAAVQLVQGPSQINVDNLNTKL